jgi:hypothetical protein
MNFTESIKQESKRLNDSLASRVLLETTSRHNILQPKLTSDFVNEDVSSVLRAHTSSDFEHRPPLITPSSSGSVLIEQPPLHKSEPSHHQQRRPLSTTKSVVIRDNTPTRVINIDLENKITQLINQKKAEIMMK